MQTISFSESQLWDEKISEHEEATIFHSSAWAKVINESYGHRTELHVSANGSLLPITEIASRITGKRGHCVPFADRCAILGETKEIPKDVISLAEDKGWEFLEIRVGNGIPHAAATSANFVRHSIRLDSDVNKRFSQSTRRAVRKAERSNLVAKVTLSDDSSGIERYYKLHTQTRRRHGLPPQPKRFFRAIQRHIISQRLGFIVDVGDRYSSHAIASAVFFQSGKTAFYKFGASDATAWNLRPNNLLFAHAITLLSEDAQSDQLDLGRSDLPDTELRRFKRGWGADEFSLNYYKYRLADNVWIAGVPPKSSGDKIHHHFFRSLPPVVNRLAGSLLYPHLS